MFIYAVAFSSLAAAAAKCENCNGTEYEGSEMGREDGVLKEGNSVFYHACRLLMLGACRGNIEEA